MNQFIENDAEQGYISEHSSKSERDALSILDQNNQEENQNNLKEPLLRDFDQGELNNLKLDKRKLNLDDFLHHVGTESWYQIRNFCYFCLQVLCISWFYTSQKYFFQKPNYQCPSNFNQIPFQNDFEDCEQWVCYNWNQNKNQFKIENYIDTQKFTAISVTFELYCADITDEIMVVVSNVFMCIGMFIFGYLSDNQGRKNTLRTCWKIFTIGNLIFPFVDVFPLFIIGYTISCLSSVSAMVMQICLINETTTGKTRSITILALWLMFVFGQFSFSCLIYIVKDWRYISYFTMTFPVLGMNFLVRVYHESPRYHYSKNKLLAMQDLNKIAKVNQKPQIRFDLNQSSWLEEWKRTPHNFYFLIKYKSLKKVFLSSLFISFSINFCYFSVEQDYYLFQMDVYLQVFFLYLTKILGYGAGVIFGPQLERKKSLGILNLICIILTVAYNIFLAVRYGVGSTILYTEFDAATIFQFILINLMRIFNSFMQSLSLLYFIELFPTAIRAIGYSAIHSTQFISFIIVYISFMLSEGYKFFVGYLILIGVILIWTIASQFVYRYMPETRDEPIQDEIKELQLAQYDDFYINFNKKKKI